MSSLEKGRTAQRRTLIARPGLVALIKAHGATRRTLIGIGVTALSVGLLVAPASSSPAHQSTGSASLAAAAPGQAFGEVDISPLVLSQTEFGPNIAAPADSVASEARAAVEPASATGPQATAAAPSAGGVEASAPSSPAASGPPVEQVATAGEPPAPDRDNRPAPAARGGRDAQSTPQDFIAQAGEAARLTQAATGVPASVTVAQAILESNWGRAAIGNNYFGIKADKPGPAGVSLSKTKEYTSEGWITIVAAFRAYDDMAQSFTDHAQFLVDNARYAEAMRNTDDPKAFAKLLQKAGYATDPKYAQSLIRLMDKHDLYRFDRHAAPADQEPAADDRLEPNAAFPSGNGQQAKDNAIQPHAKAGSEEKRSDNADGSRRGNANAAG